MLTGISKSLTDAGMTNELATGAAARWPAVDPEELRDIRVERLNRRAKADNGPSDARNDHKKWVPSASVRLHASRVLCEAILRDGGAVLGYTFHAARPFVPTTRRCLRCGQVGVHSAKFCRNTPRCRLCGREHETISCPSFRARSPAPNAPNMEGQEMRDGGHHHGAAQGS